MKWRVLLAEGTAWAKAGMRNTVPANTWRQGPISHPLQDGRSPTLIRQQTQMSFSWTSASLPAFCSFSPLWLYWEPPQPPYSLILPLKLCFRFAFIIIYHQVVMLCRRKHIALAASFYWKVSTKWTCDWWLNWPKTDCNVVEKETKSPCTLIPWRGSYLIPETFL